MKRIYTLIALMLFALSNAKADSLLDQFYAGFVGNAKFAIESTTDGGSHGEFLDNFVEMGQLRGDHIAALDAGVLGTFLPDNQHFRAAEWTTGAKIHIAPLLKSYVKVPEQWQFVSSLEIDARASYNWTQHHPYYGIVAAYPFK